MKTTFFPSYTIGIDAYDAIEDICSKSGKKAVVIGGKTAIEKARPYLEKSLENSSIKIIDWLWYGGDATFQNAERLSKEDAIKNADMIFAVGGGRAIDTCKYVKKLTGLPLYTLPTIASTCAPITKNSVMYLESGELSNLEFYPRGPEHCFINSQVIAEAPSKYLWAGIGDTIAKYFESNFSARGDMVDHNNALGLKIAELCWSDLKLYGDQGYKDSLENKASEDLERVVLTNIVTTGLTSVQVIHDYYNAGLAHALYYGMTAIPEVEENHLHGEMVAYGVLVLEYMDKDYQSLDDLIEFYRKIKLPTSYKELQLNDERIDLLVEKACVLNDIKHSPYEITEDMVKEAIYGLEKYQSW